jgi:hypothetical protein
MTTKLEELKTALVDAHYVADTFEAAYGVAYDASKASIRLAKMAERNSEIAYKTLEAAIIAYETELKKTKEQTND